MKWKQDCEIFNHLGIKSDNRINESTTAILKQTNKSA